MAAQSITTASTGFSANIIDLNPVFKETIFQVTINASVAGTSSGTYSIQISIDDPNPSTGTMTWATLSSGINSSAAEGVGQTLALLSPISAARMLTASSTTAGVVGTATLKVLQSVTG